MNEKIYFIHTTKENYENSEKLDHIIYFVKSEEADRYEMYKGSQNIKMVDAPVEELQAQLNNLLNGALPEMDTLVEIANAIKGDGDLIEQLENSTANKVDKTELESVKNEINDRINTNISNINTKLSEQVYNENKIDFMNVETHGGISKNIDSLDFVKIGIYCGNFTNAPGSKSWGVLTFLPTTYTKPNSITYGQQIFINEDSKIFIRKYSNGSLGNWKSLATMQLNGSTLEISL